jgi:hypothetical protein
MPFGAVGVVDPAGFPFTTKAPFTNFDLLPSLSPAMKSTV